MPKPPDTPKRQHISDLYTAKGNLYGCLSDMVSEFMINDSIPESVVEEVLEETLKYMEFIQRRLDEIVVDTVVDKGGKAL